MKQGSSQGRSMQNTGGQERMGYKDWKNEDR